jgi:hypothetical protein
MNRTWPGLCLMGLLALASTGTAADQDQGVRQLEKVAMRADATAQAMLDTQLQLMKTMDVYNGLLAPDAKDRKGLYKKLQQELANTEKRRAEIKVRADEMRGEAEILFQSWTDSLPAIEDASLRKRSEERQGKMRAAIADIATVAQKAAELCVPVIKLLQDHVAYLAHDLNVGAITSLAHDADKANKEVQELSVRIDEAVTSAHGKIAVLRP